MTQPAGRACRASSTQPAARLLPDGRGSARRRTRDAARSKLRRLSFSPVAPAAFANTARATDKQSIEVLRTAADAFSELTSEPGDNCTWEPQKAWLPTKAPIW